MVISSLVIPDDPFLDTFRCNLQGDMDVAVCTLFGSQNTKLYRI